MLLPPLSIHCTVLHSASDTVWYTEKPGFSVPHVFIYRVRLSGWLINIAHTGILCDHVPDFNIDFSSYFYGIIYRRIFIPTRLVRCRKAEWIWFPHPLCALWNHVRHPHL